jgi:hypothetical protein
LHLDVNTQLLPLFSPVRGHLPFLECFTLQGFASQGTDIPDAFELAPRLTKLEILIPSQIEQVDGILPLLPLAQIKTLTIFPYFLPLTIRCPQLTSLSCIPSDVPQTAAPSPIIINVTALHISPIMLQHLKAPKLDDLHLAGPTVCWSHPHLLSFIQHS